MLHSMTGFAREAADSTIGTLTCELRAVNHRYLDVQFRLPEELRPKEVELRQQLAEVLKRGKIECNLHFRRAPASDSDLRINDALVRQIGAGATEVAALVADARPLGQIDILRWPGVVEEPEIDADPLYEEACKVVAAALDSLNKMRASEGERIADMLKSRCKDVVTIAAAVRKRLPEVLEAVRAKQQERIEKLDVAADPARLEVELALISQKLDVDEELDRLESHVSEIREILGRREPVGRRLDFLMQELNREANTLGSKSADKETTKAAVDLKVLIEQMREQIQNVE
ncbi:MAG: YicC family protein [Gammaproteobacteria bacterium]|nr:YicC family protein [Gammaproteobacteria bacterium]